MQRILTLDDYLKITELLLKYLSSGCADDIKSIVDLVDKIRKEQINIVRELNKSL